MSQYKKIRGRASYKPDLEEKIWKMRSNKSSPTLNNLEELKIKKSFRDNSINTKSPCNNTIQSRLQPESDSDNESCSDSETNGNNKIPDEEFIKNSNKTKTLNSQEIFNFVRKNDTLRQGIFLCFFIALIAIFSPILYNQSKEYEISLKFLKQEFPSQTENFWLYVLSGLKNVIENNDKFKSTVYLFLNTDVKDNTSYQLSQEIARIAAKSLGGQSPIIVSNQDIMNLPAEKGYFIEHYRPRLQQNKVLVIKYLNKVPFYVAEALHYVCDSENPLVEKTVIILSMDIPYINSKKPLLEQIEDALQKQWSPPLNDNVIYPIITRLTTSVLEIVPEISNKKDKTI